MLQITGNKDEIIVQEFPAGQWFNSILIGIIFGGVVFFGLLFLTLLFTMALILGTLVFIAVFLLSLWDNPSIRLKINKQDEIISIRKSSPVGYKFIIYNFDEIAGEIYVNEFGFMPKTYQIVLPLKNGEKIELSAQIRMNEREYYDAVDLMNSYIFDTSKHLPAKVIALNKISD